MQRNQNGIAYTTSLQEAQTYRVEDTRDTVKFCKDEERRKRLLANGSRVNMYTRIIHCQCGQELKNLKDPCPTCKTQPRNIPQYFILPAANHKVVQQPNKQFHFDIPGITLHEHQNSMVKFVEKIYGEGKRSAFIIAGTGTGKSIGFLAVTQLLGLSTCIVAPNSTITKVLYDEFSKYIDTKIITGSKKIELTKVNIMCHQTFNRIYDQINGKIEVLLLDEAHRQPEKRREQINLWKGRFVLGMTATAIRKEFGLEGFSMLFGSILDTQTEALPIKLYYHTFRYDYNQDEFLKASEGLAPDSPEMYRRLVIDNDVRNDELVDIIRKFIAIGKKHFIVFSDRVDHIIKTADYLKTKFANVYEYRGDSDKEKVISEFNQLDGGIIVGNLQACGEGFNIKKLEVGILYVSTQWTVTCEQAAGRVRRVYGDKKEGIFVDFVDNLSFNGSNTKQLGRYERKKIYAKKGWQLNYI